MDRDKNKRTKVSESGTCTSSSNQDSEEANFSKERCPERQKLGSKREVKRKRKRHRIVSFG